MQQPKDADSYGVAASNNATSPSQSPQMGLAELGRRLAQAQERELVSREAQRLAQLAFWSWNTADQQLECSEELFQLLGMQRSEGSPSLRKLLRRVHSADRPLVRRMLIQLSHNRQTNTVEVRLTDSENEQRRLQLQARRMGKEGPLANQVVGTVVEVTERHEPTRRLGQTISDLHNAERLAHLGSFRVEFTKRGTQVDWSLGLSELFGVGQLHPTTLEALLSQLHPDDRGRLKKEASRQRSQPVPAVTSFRVTGPGGAVRELQAEVHPLLGDGEGAVGVRGIVQDVTQQQAMQKRLLISHKMEALGQLARGIAHDFNNNLSIISGHADLLLLKLDGSSRALKSARTISEVTQNCAELTQQLLTFSRNGKSAEQYLDLRQLLLSLSPNLKALLGEKVALELSLNAAGNTKIWASPAQIEQMVVALLLNSFEALPATGGRVSLQLIASTDNGKQPLELVLTDNGSGIPAEIQDRIFEPFFSTKQAPTARGLGLASVYGIIQQLGGNIDVGDASQGGTQICLKLPRVRPCRSPRTQPPPPSGTREAHSILVVEDVQPLRTLICQQLEAAGYQVHSASHGEAALRLLKTQTVDAIVADVAMPHLGGLELAEAAHSEHPNIACILMTAPTAEYTTTQPSNVAAVLYKPFTIRELLGTLGRQLAPTHTPGSSELRPPRMPAPEVLTDAKLP